jgi:predicted Rdx family selenoprotein
MIEVSLRSGTNGRFEVTLDDQLIVTKAKSKGRNLKAGGADARPAD